MKFNIDTFNSEQFNFLTYLVLFVLALLGGLIFRKLIKQVHKLSLSNEHDYILIPIFTVSLTTFFYILKSSLPLSLGILGSLSIIRFRTPIKDLRDTFLIIAMIAFCLLLGTENRLIASFFLIFTAVIVLSLIKFEASNKHSVLLNITYETGNSAVEQYINSELSNYKIISTAVINNKTYVMMSIPSNTNMDAITKNLINIAPNIEVQYAKN